MNQDPKNIFYRCPACHATIEVGAEFVGKRVDCPRCEVPFLAVAPEAQPILTWDPAQPADYTITKPTDDETVLREVHPSMVRQYPITFVGLCLCGVVAFVAAILLWGQEGGLFSYGLFVITLGILGYFSYWWLEVHATTLKITNKRTTLRKGIIAKSTSEVQHDDVRNLQVKQNMWQRVLGVGDLAISSSGQDDLEILVRGIAQPDDVADFIRTMQ